MKNELKLPQPAKVAPFCGTLNLPCYEILPHKVNNQSRSNEQLRSSLRPINKSMIEVAHYHFKLRNLHFKLIALFTRNFLFRSTATSQLTRNIFTWENCKSPRYPRKGKTVYWNDVRNCFDSSASNQLSSLNQWGKHTHQLVMFVDEELLAASHIDAFHESTKRGWDVETWPSVLFFTIISIFNIRIEGTGNNSIFRNDKVLPILWSVWKVRKRISHASHPTHLIVWIQYYKKTNYYVK